jgi:hypothetical protein
MKKAVILSVLLILPLLTGCKKQLYHFTGTLSVNNVYHISQTGTFDETNLITYDDIRDALNVPEGSRIDSVYIEHIAAKVTVKPGNNASNITLSATVSNGGTPKDLFKNFSVSLSGVDIPFIGLNALIAGGINLLKDQLNKYVKKVDTSTNIEVRLTGSPTGTGGNNIVVDVTLQVQGTVKYSKCLDLPDWFSDGETCPPELSH